MLHNGFPKKDWAVEAAYRPCRLPSLLAIMVIHGDGVCNVYAFFANFAKFSHVVKRTFVVMTNMPAPVLVGSRPILEKHITILAYVSAACSLYGKRL